MIGPIVQGGASVPLVHPGYKSGNWYPPVDTGALLSGTGAVPAVDTMYAHKLIIRERVTLQSLGIRVVTAGTASAVKMAIYTNDPAAKRPGSLLVQTSGVATTSANTDATAAASITLDPGVYWAASLHTGTLPTAIIISQALDFAVQGESAVNTALGNATRGTQLAQTYSSGFPASFGAGSDANVNIPAIAFRVA